MLRRFTWLIVALNFLFLLPKLGITQTQELSFGIAGVDGIPDTAYFGDVINVEFWLKNTTAYPTTIDGLLEITFATDSNIITNDTNFLANSTQSSFSPLFLYLPFQDSVKITFPETIDNRFAPGDNITVVWPKVVNNLPTTTEFSIAKIYVMGFHSSIENTQNEIVIFPNPVKDFISIKTFFEQSQIFDLLVFDALGNTVLIQENYIFTGPPLSVKSLNTGTYFLQITKGEGNYKEQIFKFTKQ